MVAPSRALLGEHNEAVLVVVWFVTRRVGSNSRRSIIGDRPKESDEKTDTRCCSRDSIRWSRPCPAIQAGFEVVAVVGRDRTHRARAPIGSAAYTSIDEARSLPTSTPVTVSILRRAHWARCSQRCPGKHVVCGKPFALNAERPGDGRSAVAAG